MGTGFSGTFVIRWSQTEIDGLDAAPVQSLQVGSAWSWRGDVVCVDGRSDVLRLSGAEGAEALRRRAARSVQRLVGAALETGPVLPPPGTPSELMDNSFVVTDGAKRFTVTVINVGGGRPPLLMFFNALPPRDREMWVVSHTLGPAPARRGAQGGVICFTRGTRIATPGGARLIDELREGDLVCTKDNGVQPILWIGQRRMTGARLFAMPHLRPVRIDAGFLGAGVPGADLIVSPLHRLVISETAAQALFNTPEVLVTAQDLIDDRAVRVDHSLREVTYIHLLLEQHQVLWANGVETESFHPASADLETLDSEDRQRLLCGHPSLADDPYSYGAFARRNLSQSEAAILRHAA